MVYKIERNECIEVTKGRPLPLQTRSSSTLFARTSQLPLQNDVMFNLLMRFNGKLTNQIEKIIQIEEKLQ
ncbi:Uncharacterized protein TCM_038688 [Theobroma cacao]|uniref:Uncharacterized protein n=1 Tax=Theobroma cacao TaxID=3641 RepID=A0A061GX75_THECC|nr:Uncharacterized protein TCM_038688 [Theobroma cacao]